MAGRLAFSSMHQATHMKHTEINAILSLLSEMTEMLNEVKWARQEGLKGAEVEFLHDASNIANRINTITAVEWSKAANRLDHKAE